VGGRRVHTGLKRRHQWQRRGIRQKKGVSSGVGEVVAEVGMLADWEVAEEEGTSAEECRRWCGGRWSAWGQRVSQSNFFWQD